MLAHRQPMISSVRRDAWVEVDLNAIERNIAVIRSWLNPGTRLMTVVKSDAYGHGAAGIAEVLAACGADWLGVASIDEGCQIRATGVQLPILLLSPCPAWALPTALDADLTLTVTSSSQIEDISAVCQRLKRKASIHLKIDTGMHRLGISPDKLSELLSVLKAADLVELTGTFTHFAKADEEEFTLLQTSKFEQALAQIKAEGHKPALIHLASGEAARRFPQTHFDMVRVGLYLYGLEPKKESDAVFPAMSVKGRINQIQEIDAGESVGYNLTWTSKDKTRVASVPIGYADGIDRRLSNRIQALLMGKKVPQIGLISMDQMLFDISSVPEAQEGDVLTLIGCDNHENGSPQIHLASWANMLDTITYELACRLRARMPRMYTRQIAIHPEHS
ncbi:MAG: alanine racemase [Candidatus Obscuribacterales bacterium]|nr:alanine racemase [Candidatus Obscuribacterales bacterium]